MGCISPVKGFTSRHKLYHFYPTSESFRLSMYCKSNFMKWKQLFLIDTSLFRNILNLSRSTSLLSLVWYVIYWVVLNITDFYRIIIVLWKIIFLLREKSKVFVCCQIQEAFENLLVNSSCGSKVPWPNELMFSWHFLSTFPFLCAVVNDQ